MKANSEEKHARIKKWFFNEKTIVDLNGVFLYYLHKSKLYDVNHNEFASCKRVKKDEAKLFGAEFVTDGKYLYKDGKAVGKIKKDHTRFLILILLLLLCLSIFALIIIVGDYKGPTVPTFKVTDTNGEWGTSGEIDVFEKDKIKPGDEGIYAFLIDNPSDINLKCVIDFTINYENNTYKPQIDYSVISEGKNFEQYDTENGFKVENVIIEKNNTKLIYLKWKWAFESGNDAEDTFAGLFGSNYTFTIKIVAEEDNLNR